MKKVTGIIIGIAGILLAVTGIISKVREQTAVATIGGVDGPTSVFIAGKLNDKFVICAILIGIILLIIGCMIYEKRHK